MLLQMGLSTFLQIIMRYIFHSAITWLDELVHVEVVILTFFGAALGMKYGSHMCVDVMKKRFAGWWLYIVEAVCQLVIAGYVFLVVYFGAGLIERMTAPSPLHAHLANSQTLPLFSRLCRSRADRGALCLEGCSDDQGASC